MLKAHSATVLVNSRFKISPFVVRLDSSATSNHHFPPQYPPQYYPPKSPPNKSPPGTSPPTACVTPAIHTSTPTLSTREFTSEEHHTRRYKPMIMSAHGSGESSPAATIEQAPREQRNSRGMGRWFPLGYKDACAQWVGTYLVACEVGPQYANFHSSSGRASALCKQNATSCASSPSFER